MLVLRMIKIYTYAQGKIKEAVIKKEGHESINARVGAPPS